jgi:ferritin
MLKKSILDALNNQINQEMYSGYFYMSMATHCESINFPGAAQWLKLQSKEEWAHAMKLYDYVGAAGEKVVLESIPKPPAEFKSLVNVFETVLEHEKKVTSLINKLYETSLKENDYATQIYLQWFVTEQVEEEKNATEIITQLKMIGEHPASLFMMDKHLGSRK